ncbi:hypothetical protein ACWC3X_00035 [Streptomyces populi]
MTTPRERADAILAEAGLQDAGGWGAGSDVLPVHAALRPIEAADAVPTVVVRLDATDPFADTDLAWFRLATAHGLFGEDGGFLVTLGHGGRFRVRLEEEWRLAEVLRNQPRCPEFMTLSPDGRTLIGVTAEEHEIWLTAVDDVPAHQERRALELAREESEEEREAAWDGLFSRLRISQRTRDRWALGLLSNASLPDGLHPGTRRTLHPRPASRGPLPRCRRPTPEQPGRGPPPRRPRPLGPLGGHPLPPPPGPRPGRAPP